MKTMRVLLIQDEDPAGRARPPITGVWEGVVVRPARAPTLADGLAAIANGGYDAAVLDLELPDCRGLASLLLLRRIRPELPVVVLAGAGDEALALEAVRLGAQDYALREAADARSLARSILFAVERSAAARPRTASVT